MLALFTAVKWAARPRRHEHTMIVACCMVQSMRQLASPHCCCLDRLHIDRAPLPFTNDKNRGIRFAMFALSHGPEPQALRSPQWRKEHVLLACGLQPPVFSTPVDGTVSVHTLNHNERDISG